MPPSWSRLRAHPIGVDLEPVEDVGQRARGVGGDAERPLEDEALRRAVADVALVPERHVLEADERVRAQQPGHAGHPLGEDRIALVRHRAAPCWPEPNGSNASPDLGALEVPDLDRDPLQRPAQDGERREQLGVPVAAHHLGRRRIRRPGPARRGRGARPSALTFACVPTAPEIEPTAIPSRARASALGVALRARRTSRRP